MSNGLHKRKKPEKVVDIKAEYERIQKEEEENRLATEKQIHDILTKGNYQYFVSINLMGAEIPLSQVINPSLAISLRIVSKPKE